MKNAKKQFLIPRIVNVMDLKSKPRGRVLIHFTATQWREAVKSLGRPVKFKAGPGALEAVPAPGSNGDMLFGGFCQSTRSQLCWMNPRPIGPLESGRGLPALAWECNCQDVPDATPPEAICRLKLERTPRFRFVCDASNCPAGCILQWQRVGRFLVLRCNCTR